MGRTVNQVATELAERVPGAGRVRPPDAELATLDVAACVEADVQTEDRLLQVRLTNLSTDLSPGRLAVLARPIDRPADDLRRDVARCAEELGIAAVRLLEGLHG